VASASQWDPQLGSERICCCSMLHLVHPFSGVECIHLVVPMLLWFESSSCWDQPDARLVQLLRILKNPPRGSATHAPCALVGLLMIALATVTY